MTSSKSTSHNFILWLFFMDTLPRTITSSLSYLHSYVTLLNLISYLSLNWNSSSPIQQWTKCCHIQKYYFSVFLSFQIIMPFETDHYSLLYSMSSLSAMRNRSLFFSSTCPPNIDVLFFFYSLLTSHHTLS